MTPQEQEMIGDLIDRVQKTQLAEKDMDAEQMLQQGLGKNPDALYILAQTVLVQKYALEQAQAQLADALNVSRQTINAIETGKFDPSLPLAFRAARLFGLRIEEIFHDQDPCNLQP